MSDLLVIDGITIRQDAKGRYSLNDLHRASIRNGANERTKEPGKFLSSPQTVELIAELTDTQNAGIAPVAAIRGGKNQGTYVAKELVYAYAMWINAAFHLKVIRTFDEAVNGRIDWKFQRSAAASTTKVANDILKMTRESQGKDTAGHHYANEQRLINSILSGEYKGLDRESLDADQLGLLAHLQERNAVLIGRGLSYAQRKAVLPQYAMDYRLNLSMRRHAISGPTKDSAHA